MTFTGEAAKLPEHPMLSQLAQEDAIFYWSAAVGVQARFLAAIRVAEAGGPGREFGVLSEPAPTYDAQCRVAAESIQHAQWRYCLAEHAWPTLPNGDFSDSFIQFFAGRWCPVGADNDPFGLNRHWVANATRAYRASEITETMP